MTKEEFGHRNAALRHAIQTGAMYEAQIRPDVTQYKHMRTPIDAQMAEFAGLLDLLIRKGVITHEEMFEASIMALEAEVARYEQRLSIFYGREITLG